MPRLSELGVCSIDATAALAVVGTVASITATGSASTDAAAIGAVTNYTGSTGASQGVILPAGNAGDRITVAVQGANSVLVYPPSGARINALTVTTGAFTVATNRAADFVYINATQICAIYGS